MVVLLSFIIPAHAEFPFIVKDIHPAGDGLSDPVYLTPLYGAVFFRGADDRHGGELWKSDGTEAGTVLVKDINPEGDSWPGSLANINGILYFSAMDEAYGWELWTSDGAEEGTTLLADINPQARQFLSRLFYRSQRRSLFHGR